MSFPANPGQPYRDSARHPRVARGSARQAGGPGGRSRGLVPGLTDLLSPVFVAVDFETANRSGGVSACQVALVKMSGGRVVDRLVTLLSPPVGWDHFEFSYLHGISAEHTRGAPDWGQVAGQVACFTASLPVFAHNAQFDARVWRQLDDFFATSSYPERFYCTYRTAQWLIPGLPNYRLPTVTRVCAPDFVLNHHRADSDAEACAMIVAALQVRARHR